MRNRSGRSTRVRAAVAAQLVLLACAALSLPSWARVIGEDDRRNLAGGEARQFRQVVSIESGMSRGTGLVFGPNCDLVLTANHVVYSPRFRRYINREFTVLAEPSNVMRRRTAALLTDGRAAVGRFVRDEDWALLKLNRPLLRRCIEHRFSLAWSPNRVECPGDLVLVAIHEDLGTRKKIHRGCRTLILPTDHRLQKRPNFFLDTCDSENWSSGAPLFCVAKQNLSVVGIHLGALVLKEPGRAKQSADVYSYANRGLTITPLLRKALMNALSVPIPSDQPDR